MKLGLFMLLAMAAVGTPLNSRAQLGETNVDGIQVKVNGMFRSGDSRDLDCDINLTFSGEKVAQPCRMSQVSVIQAVDDTGADLVRTNKQRFPFEGSLSPERTRGGFFDSIGLKSPSAQAKVIRHLKFETEITSTTEHFQVFTDVMAHQNGTLRDPLLDQCQVRLSYELHAQFEIKANSQAALTNAPGSPIQEIVFKLDDPQGNFVAINFQKSDGTPRAGVSPPSYSWPDGRQTSLVYRFEKTPPSDLRLKVCLATPKTTQKLCFDLENVRLPWVELPELRVSASTVITKAEYTQFGVNGPYISPLQLNFIGGEAARAAGIFNLSVVRAESDTGQSLKVNAARRIFMEGFNTAHGDAGLGLGIDVTVSLDIPARNINAVRVLEGEAQLFFPSLTNDGLVEFSDFLGHPGELLRDNALNRCGVKLVFVGRDNFATRKKDWEANRITISNGVGVPRNKESAEAQDSLQFAVDDPGKRLVKLEFMDGKGNCLAPRFMASTEPASPTAFRYLYSFDNPPPDGIRLRVCLVTPESLKPVKFKVENIAL